MTIQTSHKFVFQYSWYKQKHFQSVWIGSSNSCSWFVISSFEPVVLSELTFGSWSGSRSFSSVTPTKKPKFVVESLKNQLWYHCRIISILTQTTPTKNSTKNHKNNSKQNTISTKQFFEVWSKWSTSLQTFLRSWIPTLSIFVYILKNNFLSQNKKSQTRRKENNQRKDFLEKISLLSFSSPVHVFSSLIHVLSLFVISFSDWTFFSYNLT